MTNIPSSTQEKPKDNQKNLSEFNGAEILTHILINGEQSIKDLKEAKADFSHLSSEQIAHILRNFGTKEIYNLKEGGADFSTLSTFEVEKAALKEGIDTLSHLERVGTHTHVISTARNIIGYLEDTYKHIHLWSEKAEITGNHHTEHDEL